MCIFFTHIFMFSYIKRIFFFLATNFAVMILLSVVMSIVNSFYPWLLSAYGWMGNLLIVAIIIWFAGSFISLFISKWSAKRMYNITLLEDGNISDAKLQVVWDTVNRISQANNIKMPEVWYFESSDPNAFATGATKNSSLVAVSTGLLDAMEKREIEGVVGHEMAHILNGDMVTLTLIQWVMNTFVYFLSSVIARIAVSFFSRDESEESGNSMIYHGVSFLAQMVFGFLAMFVVMWFSRMREYRADLGWATFTSKSSMISGLQKLKKISAKIAPQSETKMNAFMITEPDSFFSTHPALDNRIRALEENYKLA